MRSSVICEYIVKSLTILVYYRPLAKAFLWQRGGGKRGNYRDFLDDCEAKRSEALLCRRPEMACEPAMRLMTIGR
jgi:hypothetical protein